MNFCDLHRASVSFFSLPRIEGNGLLGVQLDDEVLGDLEVDIVSGGQSQDLALKGVLVPIQPLGSSDESIVFLQLLVESVLHALLADSDHVAHPDHVGGDVDALAVDGEMTVVDKLTGLTTGVGKAQTIDHVVEAALDEAQQDLTGVALGAGGLLVVGAV